MDSNDANGAQQCRIQASQLPLGNYLAALTLRDGRLASYTPRVVGVRDDEAANAERSRAVEAAATKAAKRSNGANA